MLWIKWPKKIKVKHETHAAKGVEIEVEVPQVDENLSLVDFANDFALFVSGAEDYAKDQKSAENKAKSIINNWLGNGAVSSVRSGAASASKDISKEDFFKKMSDLSHDYVPQEGRSGTSVAAAAKNFSNLKALTVAYRNGELDEKEYTKQMLSIMGLEDSEESEEEVEVKA